MGQQVLTGDGKSHRRTKMKGDKNHTGYESGGYKMLESKTVSLFAHVGVIPRS